MKNIAKRALGLTSALFFVGAMALVASPVQAADVDTRINALERELALLKQSQEVASEERALAAEMKAPSFSYKAGKGLTIAAADNNWSIKFTQRLQVFSTFYMTQENVGAGLQHGQMRIRRFRPSINVTSQQGFYAVNWTFNTGKTGGFSAFDGDGYINFNKINPYMPSLGWGFNPSFSGVSTSLFTSEGAVFSDSLGMGGGQDRSLVLAWKNLPAMGTAKVAHLNFAFGHDEMDEYDKDPAVTDKSRSLAASIGIKPLGGSKMMGGIDLSSFQYSFVYESLRNGYNEGVADLKTVHATRQIKLASIGSVVGDHTYYGHGFAWNPLKWMNLLAHYVAWAGDADAGMPAVEYAPAVTTSTVEADTTKNPATIMITPPSDEVRGVMPSSPNMEDRSVNELGLGLRVWMWGPKSGALGGSASEGGISIATAYSVIDIKKRGTEVMKRTTTDNDDMTVVTDADSTTLAGDPLVEGRDMRVRRKGGEVTNTSVIVDYYVPGGWLKISGVWDNYSCDMSVCHSDVLNVATSATDNDDSFNTFTLMMEYKF